MSTPSICIRPLLQADLPFLQELVAVAGWNQTPQYLEELLADQPDGCWLALWNEEPAGTVTTTVYDRRLAWIGMMLVHPDLRRRGIASALMKHAIAELQAMQVPTIKLDATPAGRAVYELLGFRADCDFRRWQRDANAGSRRSEAGPDMDAFPTAAHSQLDRLAFGTDRTAWLRRLARLSTVITRDEGFGMLRAGRLAQYLGPVVAGSEETATAIVAQLLEYAEGTIFWDVPDHAAATSLASRLGFEPSRLLTRMTLGVPLEADRPFLQYALAGPATG